jgi:hypothetical protein
VAGALVLAAPMTSRAQSPVHTHGQWSDKVDIQVQGTHVAVARDSTSDSTRVLLFGGQGPNLKFGQWVMSPGNGLQTPVVSGGDKSFHAMPSTYPFADIFCSGHSSTADGRLLITSGEYTPGVGIEKTYLWDPTQTATDSLRSGPTMAQERWYPSNLSMDDGTILTFAGTRWAYMPMFGGTTSSGQQQDFRALALGTKPGTWKWWDPQPSGGPPVGREDHAACLDPISRMFVIGGDDNGASSNGKRNDAWMIERTPPRPSIPTDSTWQWVNLSPAADSTHGTPTARSDHTAICHPVDSSVVIYGGVDASGNALQDVWRLRPSGAGWAWKRVMETSAPGERYGHTATYLPPGDGDPNHRMVVFGGRDASAVHDRKTWSLIMNDSLHTWTWEVMESGAGVGPSARYDHGAARDIDGRRVVVFGGRDLSALSDLTSYRLIRLAGSYQWLAVATPQDDSVYGRPAKRHRHAVMYDKDWNQLTIFGGDTSASSPLLTNETWALSFYGGTPRWKRILTASSPTPPTARAGHTVVYDLGYQTARLPERFDPLAGSSGTWSVLGSAEYSMVLYPFMFQMPDRKVIYAGPWGSANATQRYLLDPATGTWLSNTIGSNIRMGSAVMYRPGRIMRCGALSAGDGQLGHNRTDTLHYSPPGSSLWDEIAAGDPLEEGTLVPRANHNLTVLPTGQVLATGGLDGPNLGSARKRPQIWTPRDGGGSGAWGDSLNPDPSVRNYHSAAILLPDARVLSSGGEYLNLDKLNVTVYSPPYLFKSNGDLAPRPKIVDYKRSVQYGQTFTVCVDSFASIKSVCLIRPGAVTHAFNQDQRFVPMSFVRAGDPTRFLVTAPVDGATAPPGDYLLFVLDSTGTTSRVPSIGRWIRLGPHADDVCDGVPPARVGSLTATIPCLDAERIDLSWTAPADDALLAASGPAWTYEVRYKTSGPAGGDTLGWFESATPFEPVLAPDPVGTEQEQSVVGLADNTTYWFGVRAVDDNGLPGVARVVSKKTQYIECEGGLSGGGEGGGSSLRRSVSTFSAVGVDVSPSAGNSLFEGASEGTAWTDALHLPEGSTGASLTAWVRAAEGHAASIDRARLVVADHAPDGRAFALDGAIVAGTILSCIGAIDGDGADVRAEIEGVDGYLALRGGAVTATLGTGDSEPTILILAARRAAPRADPDSSGIDIQVPDGAGWRTIARHHPRRSLDEVAFDIGAHGVVRLQFASDVEVRSVGRLTPSAVPPSVSTHSPSTARHALGLGALEAVAERDSLSATLVGPDSLDLSFDLTPIEAGLARTIFLEVDGTRLAGRVAESLARRPIVSDLPTRFALHQNRPNPFTHATTLRFDLPVPAQVRLAVFDVQGRLRSVVANGWFPAGTHALTWSGGDADGARLGPGVYFYALQAGDFSARRKMVRLP